jgi:hypothetical protein
MASPLDDWPLSTFGIQTIATHSAKQVSCTSLNCGRWSNSQSRKYNFFSFFFRTYYSRSIWNPLRNRSSNLSRPPTPPRLQLEPPKLLNPWPHHELPEHSFLDTQEQYFLLRMQSSAQFCTKTAWMFKFPSFILSFDWISSQIWSIESLD